MSRKPYLAKQADNWYMQSRFFKIYMLRELTSVPVVLAALNLFCGIAALAGSPENWMHWVAAQKNPVLIFFNLLAIAAAVFNSLKWFEAMPKAVRIQKGEKFVDDKLLIRGSWAAFAGVFVLLALLVMILA